MSRTALGIVLAILLVSIAALSSSVPTARAITTIYIQADGTISPTNAPIQGNGDVYTLTGNINSDADGIVIERNNTVLDGAGYTLQGTNTPSSIGIYTSGISSVTIRNINVKAFESGILLDAYSTFNQIIKNKVEDNDYGINCWAYSDSNSIIGNNITANHLVGIWIVGSSDINVSENNMMGNSQYGMSLESSSNSSVFHNNFINNANQIHIYDSTSFWDDGYPSGGNYWNDYSGVDSNGDGIGDTPYPIDENNQDRYPLMKPWTNIAILDISPSKTVVGKGFTLYIYVSVQNQGWNTETLNITAKANTTIIATFMNITLTSRNSSILTFTWNTSGFARGNYTISAVADAVPGETDFGDNTLIDGEVMISKLGDLNLDGAVNYKDASLFRQAYIGAYNYLADFNQDEVINYKDASLFRTYYITG